MPLAEVETLNAESDPIANGLSEEQRRYYTALRGAYAENMEALLNEATLSGCGVSPNGLDVDPSGYEVCAHYADLVRQERQKFVELGSNPTLGRVNAAARVRELAGRRGSATLKVKQELGAYAGAMGEDAIAFIEARKETQL